MEFLNKDLRFSRLLILRSIAYLIMTGILAFFGESLLPPGESLVSLSTLYGVLVGVAIVQFLFLLVKNEERNLLILTLTDICVATFVVKSTGASSSSFVFLFPLLSLVSSVLFAKKSHLVIAILVVLALIPLAIGFGASIAGTVIFTIVTGIVGFSLRVALERTGTALNQTEAHKRRLESLQRAIMANIPSGLISVDSRGKVIQVNKVAHLILGLEEGSLLGTLLKETLPHLDQLRSQLETQTSISDISEPIANRRTFSFVRKDGKELKLGYSLARLLLPDSREIIGTLILFQDLTEAIHLEETHKLSEKLAAVGKLAAGIAHEIRNPLAGISGAAQLLEIEELSEDSSRLLNIIKRESARLDTLIGEFLEFVKPAPPKKEPVKLHKIAGHVVETLSVNAKWQALNCRVHFAAEPSEVDALGDENKISQVMLNLLLNAGQAGAADVWVEVNDGLHIKILDNGPGIPADIQAHIFEPFFTTKDKGTGLGLAIAYKTLEAVGAQLQLKSPIVDLFPKGGTLFEIHFQKAGSQKEAA